MSQIEEHALSHLPYDSEPYYFRKYDYDEKARGRFHPEVLQLREILYEAGEKAGWTHQDYHFVQLAELVALESLEWHTDNVKKVRYDGKPWATHLYRLAIAGAEAGESPSQIIKRLLHDSIEDTKKNQNDYHITESMLHALFSTYDGTIAHTVQLLSKLKTDYQDRDNALQTHKRLYELIAYDPQSIAIKLDDRIDYFDTAKRMSPQKRRLKARETMEYYWPLAIGFGWHWKARELSEKCIPYLVGKKQSLEFSHTKVSYSTALILLESELKDFINDPDSVAWTIRLPGLSDVYQLTQGHIERIGKAWIPAFMTITADVSRAPVKTESDGIFDHVALPFLRHLAVKGIITKEEYSRFSELMASGIQRTAHIDIHIKGVPVRLRFSTVEDEAKWRASIADITSQKPELMRLRRFAIEKRDEMRQMYKYYVDAGVKGYKLLWNIKDCLIRGTTMVRVEGSPSPIVLPAHSTVFDLALAHSSDRDDPRIIGVQQKIGGAWFTAEFGAEVQRDGIYHISYSTERVVDIRHLDYVQTAYGRDQVLGIVRKQISSQNEHWLKNVNDVIDHGVSTIQKLFIRYARMNGKNIELHTDISVAFPVYKNIPDWYEFDSEHFSVHEDTKKLVNLLMQTGMKDIPVDSGRSSILWEVVAYLYTYQTSLREVPTNVPDAKGQLASVSAAFSILGINIQSAYSDPDYMLQADGSMSDTKIIVLLDPVEHKKYTVAGGDSALKEVIGNISIEVRSDGL